MKKFSKLSYTRSKNLIEKPLISILVSTFNEQKTISHKLKNLTEIKYPNYEYVFIDGGSNDKTVNIIKEFLKINNISAKVIEEKLRMGKAHSLNNAFKYCNGEIVVITDADAIWDKDALTNLVKSFDDENVGAVTGKQILMNANQSFSTISESKYNYFYSLFREGESAMDSTPIFHGEIAGYRKNLIEYIEEDSMADDSELALKIRKKGYRTISEPSSVFFEFAPPDIRSAMHQKVRRAQGLIQLFWRQREFLFNRKFGRFGAIIFPAEFFMHIISPPLMVSILILFFSYTYLLNPLYFATFIISPIVLFFFPKIKNTSISKMIYTFISYQLILFFALLNQMLGRNQKKWKKITSTRDLFNNRAHEIVLKES